MKSRKWAVLLGGIFVLWGVLNLVATAVALREIGEAQLAPGATSETVALLMSSWIWPLGLGLLLLYWGNASQAVSHWYRLIDGLSAKPSVIYDAICEQVAERQIPGAKEHDFTMAQRGLFGARRVFLRVRSGYFRFDICASPYGRDFGVTWRCYSQTRFLEHVLISIPILGWILYFLFFRYTAYVEDRGLLFQTAMQRCVQESLDPLLEAQGLRALSETDYQPVLADAFKRWR